ncbi:MAG: AbrB/MazE/SpoVT family DNA-binding domain-containing protein [Thermodesulfobacteriota bacterium]
MTEVIKVTSKGQITIPANIRKRLRIDKDSYIAVETIGDYIVMKKVALKLKEISDIIQKSAKEKGITEKDIESTILKSRKEVWV